MNDIPPPNPAAEPPLATPTRQPAIRRPRRRRSRASRFAALLLLPLAGAAGGSWWWMQGDRPTASPVTAEVVRGDVADLVTALGTLQPLRYVDVGAQVSGQLQRLHVQIGDRVKAGDLLAEIDPRVIQARLNGNTAELERLRGVLAQQEAQRDLAQAQARRQQTMFASNATSRDALDTALAQVRVLEAQIAQTRSQIQGQESVLANDRTNLSFTRIVAPRDGTVVSIDAVEGQTLNANYSTPTLMRIADLSTMTVKAQVSEADHPKLTIGMPVRFNTLGRPDRHYEAALRQIYPTPEVVNNVVLYSALFDVPNPDGALLPQMSAQVYFVRAEAKDVVLVPVAALSPARRDPTHRTVRMPNQAGEPQPREVTIGVSDRVNAEVKAGLEPGDRVVVSAGPPPQAGGGARRPAGRPPRL